MLGQLGPEVTPALFGLIFLEGLLAFLSPCILPMLPIYLVYLSGSDQLQHDRRRLLKNTLGFILGFTVVFVLLGASASSLGSMLAEYRPLLQRIGGLIMIIFGLNFLGVINVGVINQSRNVGTKPVNLRFFSSAVFGAAFSIGWTPCLGAFLGSALLLASNTATLYQGSALLLVFSLGLAVPFVLTALLWDRLQKTLAFMKRNTRVVKAISGGLLIAVGILLLFDLFGYYLGLFV